MEKLLAAYSLQDILIFLVIFALAVKGFFTFWDWAVEALREIFKKETDETNRKANVAKKLKEHDEQISNIEHILKEHLNESHRLMNLLVNSDKDDIKAWITEKHHYFCYEKKYIDDYSLDCIEKRYAHYKNEGGNSFVDHLMDEIRALPRISMMYEMHNVSNTTKE